MVKANDMHSLNLWLRGLGCSASTERLREKARAIGLCFLVLALILPGTARAQAVGAIVGAVSDPSGAMVPDARITATNVATGISQSTVTGRAGTYTIPNLVVGTYAVSAEKSGFKTANAAGVTLDVSQHREVDFKLTLAGTDVKVEVTAAPPLLNTTDGLIGALVTGQEIETLPLNGRNIAGLVFTQPGIFYFPGSMGFMTTQWISNGNRGETLVAQMDGGDATDTEMGTPQFANFNLDAIAEFKVLQDNYSAQYGQGAGTITQIATKNGTNEFHGSAFDFLRNSALDARYYFAESAPQHQRNEFGATFGGPIRKSKTFFFVEYGGYRESYANTVILDVPSTDERKGLVSVTGVPGASDPNATYHYQLPLSNAAQKVLSTYPKANQSQEIQSIPAENAFVAGVRTPTNADQFSVRVDQHFSDKDSVFVRVSYVNNSQPIGDPSRYVIDPSFSSNTTRGERNSVLGYTHVFSPTLLNSLTLTVPRTIQGVWEPNQNTSTIVFNSSPYSGGLAFSSWGPDSFVTKYVNTNPQGQDNLTWTKGRHTFNLGGSYMYAFDNGFGVTSVGYNGQYTFGQGPFLTKDVPSTDGGPTLKKGTDCLVATICMMQGVSQIYNAAVVMPGFGPQQGAWWGLRTWHLAGWAQDDFKVTPKLTLNLGLRYEYNAVPWEVKNRFARLGEPNEGNLFGHFVLNPQPLYKPDYKGLAPRFGAAYKVNDKTVVRGGFAIFTNSIPTVYPDQALVNFPMSAFITVTLPTTFSLAPQQLNVPPITTLSGQVMPPNGNSSSIPRNTPVDIAPIAAALGNGTVIGDYPSGTVKNGYTVSANLTLEREIPGGINASASYILNNAYNLLQQNYPNAFTGAQPQNAPYSAISPGIGEIQVFYNGAHSNYNALQLEARKTSTQLGLTFQANYTWAKNLATRDEVWSVWSSEGAVTLNDPTCPSCEYGPTSWNIEHQGKATFIYHLPFGHFTHVPKRLVEGWQLTGIFTVQTGTPFTVATQYGTWAYGYDDFTGIGARPYLLREPTYARRGLQYFSDDVIGINNSQPGVGTGYFGVSTVYDPLLDQLVNLKPGTERRNMFVGPGYWNLDGSLIKDTKITEGTTLQFRAEFFNWFNHPNLGGVDELLGDANFGFLTSASTERQIQFGLRLVF